VDGRRAVADRYRTPRFGTERRHCADVKSAEMQKKLADRGARLGGAPAEAAAFMKAESNKWAR
jgi:hypothetical protein